MFWEYFIFRVFPLCRVLCLSMANPNLAHPQLFLSFCKSTSTIRKHIFCSWLPSHTLAPTFHTSPLQFSPICGRTWCLHIAPLRCDTTSHNDMFNWPQLVYTAGHMQSMWCVDSSHVSEEPCACTHTCAKFPFRSSSVPVSLVTGVKYYYSTKTSVRSEGMWPSNSTHSTCHSHPSLFT